VHQLKKTTRYRDNKRIFNTVKCQEIGYETITGIATKEAFDLPTPSNRTAKEIPEVVECHFFSRKIRFVFKKVCANNEEFEGTL
jgi:hypothetical protein